MLVAGFDGFREDYEHHVKEGCCSVHAQHAIPCVALCPAQVDIPGYVALVGEKRYADAVRLIRKDNPFPTACAMICEHPCEARCRRSMVDVSINIRGLKLMAVEHAHANTVPIPEKCASTGKKVAIIGGGPSGLSAAYYLELMGHHAVVFEEKKKLGGMLRYGIPNYRFPKNRLDEDINAILSAGDIEVRYETMVGNGENEIPVNTVRKEYDAMFVAIGAQKGKTLRLDGIEGTKNIESAVEMLDKIGNGQIPDYTGKTVVVIGGGNVAMDAARSAMRCGAKDVRIVYRRRQNDMTALESEIESAIMEGIEIITLMAPKAIKSDENGNCIARSATDDWPIRQKWPS